MHDEMAGFYEVRVEGQPNRTPYRLFRLLERDSHEVGLDGPSIIVVAGKPLTVSPDGRLVAYAETAGGIAVVGIEGEKVLRIPGVGVNDLPLQCSRTAGASSSSIPGEIPARLFTVDIDRGERRLVREIEPRDPVAVYGNGQLVCTRDGQAYAYSYQQYLSDLYLVEGLR